MTRICKIYEKLESMYKYEQGSWPIIDTNKIISTTLFWGVLWCLQAGLIYKTGGYTYFF